MLDSTETSVGVVFDTRNEPLQVNLCRMPLTNDASVSVHPMETLGINSNADEIARQMQGHKVAIVAIGVTGEGRYQQRIGTLLDAWLGMRDRPALLLPSLKPDDTHVAIRNWIQSNNPPAPLKEAMEHNHGVIKVVELNDFLRYPEYARTMVQNCISNTEIHKDALAVTTQPPTFQQRIHSAWQGGFVRNGLRL